MFSLNFPSDLKNANTTPIFQKKNRANVENCCSVTIFPNLSKVCERFMYIQIYQYLNKVLSKCQCGFYQVYSAQHCLLIMVEKRRQYLHKGGVSETLITDLSKPFDCI